MCVLMPRDFTLAVDLLKRLNEVLCLLFSFCCCTICTAVLDCFRQAISMSTALFFKALEAHIACLYKEND